MKSKIILFEGIPGSGKTTLINALIKKHVREKDKIKTFFNLSQSHTYSPVISEERSFYASKEAILAHLDCILEILNLGISLNHHLPELGFSCLMDSLHLTHCFRPGKVNWEDVSPWDQKLAELGVRLIFLKALPSTIWDRAISERDRKDPRYLSKYQSRYGSSLEEVHQYYLGEQTKMYELFEYSKMPKLELNAEASLEDKISQSYPYLA